MLNEHLPVFVAFSQTSSLNGKQGLIERVAVVFFDTENIPLERFIFKLSVNQSCDSKVEDADLEFSLRSFLIKLSVAQPLTSALSQGKLFKYRMQILSCWRIPLSSLWNMCDYVCCIPQDEKCTIGVETVEASFEISFLVSYEVHVSWFPVLVSWGPFL